jgi:hypothetical protein
VVAEELAMTAPPLTWGTVHNPRGCWLDGGRVHIVHPEQTLTAWCGVLVEVVSTARPMPHPDRPTICPECSINYLAATYPAE